MTHGEPCPAYVDGTPGFDPLKGEFKSYVPLGYRRYCEQGPKDHEGTHSGWKSREEYLADLNQARLDKEQAVRLNDKVKPSAIEEEQ